MSPDLIVFLTKPLVVIVALALFYGMYALMTRKKVKNPVLKVIVWIILGVCVVYFGFLLWQLILDENRQSSLLQPLHSLLRTIA